VPVLDAVFDAAGLLAADFAAADFETDFLTLPVFEAAAAWGTGFAFVPTGVAVFFFAAGACWPDAAKASANAAIDTAMNRNVGLPF
jgi:hypothetical protein